MRMSASRLFRTYRMPFWVLIAMVLSGCAIEFGVDSAGRGCFGFGCPRAEKTNFKQDRITLSLSFETTFSGSVKPSIDNFMRRYDTDSKNAMVKHWIDEFFEPAQQILGSEFAFDPKLKFSVLPKKSQIDVLITQDHPTTFTAADPVFKTLVALSGIPEQEIQKAKCFTEVHAKIWASDDNIVQYRADIEIILDVQRNNSSEFSRITNPNHDEAKKIISRLVTDLSRNYFKLFENRYGLKVTDGNGIARTR